MAGLELGDQNHVRVIAIIRGCPPHHLLKVAEAVTSEGINAVEITFDSDEPAEGVRRLSSALPGVAIGAGTVLTEDQLVLATTAGATYVVSPITDPAIIESARNRGVHCIPGAATPTEVRYALSLGAHAVKLFPAGELGGPPYLRSVLTPLGSVDLVPTGGVTGDNASKYLEAGASALGVGSWLFPSEALASGDVSVVAGRAEALMKAVRDEP